MRQEAFDWKSFYKEGKKIVNHFFLLGTKK